MWVGDPEKEKKGGGGEAIGLGLGAVGCSTFILETRQSLIGQDLQRK